MSKPIIYIGIKQNTIRKYFRKNWGGSGATGTLMHCYCKSKMAQPLWLFAIPYKIKKYIYCIIQQSILDIDPKYIKTMSAQKFMCVSWGFQSIYSTNHRCRGPTVCIALFYTILYKGLKYPWNFVFTGCLGNNPPQIPRDDCN